MDLKKLSRKYGAKHVAAAMGVTERNLTDIRSGHYAMTIDDLYELERTFPLFDPTLTIRRLGRIREEKGRSRKFRKTQAKGKQEKTA